MHHEPSAVVTQIKVVHAKVQVAAPVDCDIQERSQAPCVVGNSRGNSIERAQDDWEAAESWISALGIDSHNAKSAENTRATYRHHLHKVRWYVEQISRVALSHWLVQDVEQFCTFLAEVPKEATCKRGSVRGDAGWRPFRLQPSASSQVDIRSFLHALFNAWCEIGRVHRNPMAPPDSALPSRLAVSRVVRSELMDEVIDQLANTPTQNRTVSRHALRDIFIFTALRDLGLRPCELVQARMSAFYQLLIPGTGQMPWIFLVAAQTAKGGKAQHIPTSEAVVTALKCYREAFGLPALPPVGEQYSLILSTRTRTISKGIGGSECVGSPLSTICWRAINTPQGLSRIVTVRLEEAAARMYKAGRVADAQHVRECSPHWLRHTLARTEPSAGKSTGVYGNVDVRAQPT